MRRRAFISLLGGAAVAWPLAARAQQAGMPVVGFLRSTPAASFVHLVEAFRHGLKEEGFVEGQNIAIEQRWADNQIDRLPGLVADLLRRQVAVIVGNQIAAEAARAATATVPIVFVTGNDPVQSRLVASLSRPAGNLTGVTFFGGGLLGAKRVELLRDMLPNATVIAVLLDPSFSGSVAQLPDIEAAGHALGRQIVIVNAGSEREFEAAFANIVRLGAHALMVGGGPIHISNRQQIVALAARHKLPAIYATREYVAAGGLMSYAASFAGGYRQAGAYAGKILKGAKPSELPVLQPTTFELVINLKTAKALGLAVPPSIMLRADEVIE
jgi:putative ABC transport system substrate-binding protein